MNTHVRVSPEQFSEAGESTGEMIGVAQASPLWISTRVKARVKAHTPEDSGLWSGSMSDVGQMWAGSTPKPAAPWDELPTIAQAVRT